jgi:malonyl-CoA/methylmalonyl-CoA synthetase
VPHPDLGEGVVAAVVPRDPAFADEAAVIAALEGTLARFKQPRRVYFLPELPKNSMGKVQKTALREMFGDAFTA